MEQVFQQSKKALTNIENKVSHRMQALLAEAQRYGVQVANFSNEEVLQCEIRVIKARLQPYRSIAALSL